MDQGTPRLTAAPQPANKTGSGEPELPGWDTPDTSRSKEKRFVLILLLAVVLIIAGFAAYWFLFKPSPAKPQSKTDNSASAQPTADAAGNSAPTQYVSEGSDLNLNLTYPGSWTVSPPSGGNTAGQTITFTSPRSAMADSQDNSVIARAVVTIRPKSDTIDELSSGTATIALDSIQIAYSNPTKSQHGYPFITFIHLAGGSNPNKLFEEVMITGANKFTAGQVLSPYSLLQLDPIISVTFYQCRTEGCSGNDAVPLSISNDIWQTSDLGQQVLAMFESLQIH